MVVNQPHEIIEREKLIIASLRASGSNCEGCTIESIQYHKDIIYWMELLIEKAEEALDGAL